MRSPKKWPRGFPEDRAAGEKLRWPVGFMFREDTGIEPGFSHASRTAAARGPDQPVIDQTVIDRIVRGTISPQAWGDLKRIYARATKQRNLVASHSSDAWNFPQDPLAEKHRIQVITDFGTLVFRTHVFRGE